MLKTLAYIIQESTKSTPKMSDENWWLAFVPIVIVTIMFFLIKWGFQSFFRGDRFVAALFRISKERQAEMIEDYKKRAREQILNERKKA